MAKEILNSKVEVINKSVYDLSPEELGKFDIVFFLGVLYHLRNPFLALDKISSVTNNMLIVATHVYKDKNKVPLMRFTPGEEWDKKPTNWWCPNPICLKMLVKASGFQSVNFVSKKNTESLNDMRAIPGKILQNTAFFNIPEGEAIGEVCKGQKVLILGNIMGRVDVKFDDNDWIRIRMRIGNRKAKGYIRGNSVAKTKSYIFRKLISDFLPTIFKQTFRKCFYPKSYNIKLNTVKGIK